MKTIYCLIVLLFASSILMAAPDSSQGAFNGLFIEVGLNNMGYCYPYDAQMYNREIIGYQKHNGENYKGQHQFSGSGSDIEAADLSLVNLALGYKLSDFCLTVGFYHCTLFDPGLRTRPRNLGQSG